MWLLSTSGNELRSFVSPEEAISEVGGFAILSHTWGDGEQSLQDVQAIIREATKSGADPRELLSAKIQECCKLAEREGYKWVWIDTCCIDKTSSAELSEAINSMYRYYSLASVCYVYLEDWHANDCNPVESFCECRWHSRGWTLQELIAPKSVSIYNSSWRSLGSKADITLELELATRIPQSVLRHELPVSDFSIAQRMSWAAQRRTKRVEDEAYSLLGIFGVNMPTIYGEGTKAFRRLQEEIMRQNPDPTLFAWGPTALLSPNDLVKTGTMTSEAPTPEKQYDLFASRSADFLGGECIEYLQWVHGDPNPHIPRITLTPLGAHIPKLRIAPICPSVYLADFCSHNWQRGQHLYLVLVGSSERARAFDILKSKPSRTMKRCHLGATLSGQTHQVYRMVLLDTSRHKAQLKWKEAEVNIVFQSSSGDHDLTTPRSVMVHEIGVTSSYHDVPFCWSPSRMVSGYMSGDICVKLEQVTWDTTIGARRLWMVCEGRTIPRYKFTLRIGVCPPKGRRGSWGAYSNSATIPWASIVVGHDELAHRGHDCVHDHIMDWSHLAKQFVLLFDRTTGTGDRYRVTLKFTDRYSDGTMFWMNDLLVEKHT